MNQGSAAISGNAVSAGSGSRLALARHFVEMLLAMFVGMAVLGGLATLAFALGGSSLTDQSGGLRVLLMGFDMTVPMILWMHYRGHAAARNAEMAASMIVPSAIAAALAWGGTLEAGAAMEIQHAVMVPAMLGVMLWRYADYSRPHAR
jgi:hypothetical protein